MNDRKLITSSYGSFKITKDDPDIQVYGELLLDVFKNPPYSWKDNVLLIIISACFKSVTLVITKSFCSRFEKDKYA